MKQNNTKPKSIINIKRINNAFFEAECYATAFMRVQINKSSIKKCFASPWYSSVFYTILCIHNYNIESIAYPFSISIVNKMFDLMVLVFIKYLKICVLCCERKQLFETWKYGKRKMHV